MSTVPKPAADRTATEEAVHVLVAALLASAGLPAGEEQRHALAASWHRRRAALDALYSVPVNRWDGPARPPQP